MKVCFLLGLIGLSLVVSAQDQFKDTVETEKKPWSHLNFRNDPDNFQFAIVSDRTGGLRPGVFPKAIKKINLLEPEFVITVGDLIAANRHTENEADIHKMWDEMDTFISYLDMPFFYLAGNHDNGSPLMAKVWKERFGVEYYHFVYKNVLFLCMNAQDDNSFTALIKEKQQAWAKKILADHPEVRWTFVFIHQPVWTYEKGVPIDEGGRSLEPRDTGWQVIEDALEGRKHTVFAGHVHQYIRTKQEAPNTNYYSLATTGGGSRMRGANFGEFDHAMWVTMTEEGPKLANLLIDGILPEDVNTTEQELFRGLVSSSSKIVSLDPYKIQIDLEADNKLGMDLRGHLGWAVKNFGWQVDLMHEHVTLGKDQSYKKSVTLTYHGKPADVEPYPSLELNLQNEEGRIFAAQAKVGVDQIIPYFERHNIKLHKALKIAKAKQEKAKSQKAKKLKAAARQEKEKNDTQ